MNNEQVNTFETRQSIIDNIEKLHSYGKKTQKNKLSGQMSLFGAETVEIEIDDIIVRKLSEYELRLLSEREIDLIGLPITYNEFDDYILLEKILCNIKLIDASLCTENNKMLTFIGKVSGAEVRESKRGNKYAKIFIERGGVIIKLYLFGNDWKRTYQQIFIGQIYIVKCIYNNELYSLKKIVNCEAIDTSQYIESINISIPNKKVSLTNAYLTKNVILRGQIPINFKIDNNIYKSIYIGSFNSENCLELIKLGCGIQISRKL